MDMSSEEAEIRGITTRSVIIGLILAVILTFIGGAYYHLIPGIYHTHGSTYGRTPYASPYTYAWNNFYNAIVPTTFVIFIITLINMAKPVLSKHEVAVISIILLVSGILNSCGTYTNNLYFFFTYGWGYLTPTRCPSEEDVARIQQFMAPIMACGNDKEYWQMVMSTWWSPIRWDYVLPMILWGSLLVTILAMVGVFVALITRRLYVDVEALPFPIANVTNEMINTSQPTDGKKVGFLNKFFLLGFLIQFLWLAIGNIPWDIWSYVAYGEQTPWGTGRARFGDFYIFPIYDATQLAILPWVSLNIMVEPWLIGWGCLLPLEVIIGCLIGWFIFQIIVPVMWTAMGTWEAMPTGSFGYISYRLVRGSTTPNIGMIYLGGLIALAFFPIIRNMGTMGPIFAAITGKEPPEDVDPEKPLPYKIAIWGFILSMIIYVALAMVADVMPLWSLVWILLTAVFLFGGYRFVAETGGYMGCSFGHPFHLSSWPQPITSIILATLPGVIGVESRSALMTYAFTAYGLGTLFSYVTHYGGYMTLESFKLAKMSNVSIKNLWKIIIVTIVITLFVYGFAVFFWQAAFPGDMRYGGVYPWLGAGLFFNIYQKNIATGVPYWMDRSVYLAMFQEPGPVDTAIKLVIGIAIVVGLMMARERYPWLRISAAGIILGLAFGMKFWGAFIVALLIKYVALRIGGVQLYEEKVKPIMIGFFYGWALETMIRWIIGTPAWIRGYYKLI